MTRLEVSGNLAIAPLVSKKSIRKPPENEFSGGLFV